MPRRPIHSFKHFHLHIMPNWLRHMYKLINLAKHVLLSITMYLLALHALLAPLELIASQVTQLLRVQVINFFCHYKI